MKKGKGMLMKRFGLALVIAIVLGLMLLGLCRAAPNLAQGGQTAAGSPVMVIENIGQFAKGASLFSTSPAEASDVDVADVSANFVPNPSFEDGITSPTGWDPCGDNTLWDSSVAHTGSRSARNPRCLWISSPFALPSGLYYFGFWHRETSTVNYAGAWLGAGGGYYWTFADSAYADGQWHYYEATVQLPSYSDMRVWLMGSSDSAGVNYGPAGTVWYDDVYLGTEPPSQMVTGEGILVVRAGIPECPYTWLEDCSGTSLIRVGGSMDLTAYEGEYVHVSGYLRYCFVDTPYIDVTDIEVLPNPCVPTSVDIWVDRGEGATYPVGDPITLCYSVSRPIYVRIWVITSEGS
jgi:hypothetical protein